MRVFTMGTTLYLKGSGVKRIFPGEGPYGCISVSVKVGPALVAVPSGGAQSGTPTSGGPRDMKPKVIKTGMGPVHITEGRKRFLSEL